MEFNRGSEGGQGGGGVQGQAAAPATVQTRSCKVVR